MRNKLIIPLCMLLCMAACQAPASSEPAPTAPATEATTVTEASTTPTVPTEPETTLPTAPETEPKTEPPTEPVTEPATEVASEVPLFLTGKPPAVEMLPDTATGETPPNPAPYGSPMEEFLYLLNEAVYIDAYWEKETVHVIPLPEYRARIEAAAKESGTGVVVDDPGDYFAAGETMYSSQELIAAHDYLDQHSEELGIQSAHFSIEHLGRVEVALVNNTEESRAAVLKASPVDALVFTDAWEFENPTTGEAIPPAQPYDPAPYDSTDHPILGPMSMTHMERAYTIAIADGDIELPWGLMKDPHYLDICGGFSYRGGTMYIYSLDHAAVEELVGAPLTEAGIPYQLVETPVSLRELNRLLKEIEADPEEYDAASVRYMPRYNQIAVVRNDMERIDPDLQKLADENPWVEILADPYEIVSNEPVSVIVEFLVSEHPELYNVFILNEDGETEIRVTDIERAKEVINEYPEVRLAYLLAQDEFKFARVEYSKKALDAALSAAMDAVWAMTGEMAFSNSSNDYYTLDIHAKGVSDPAVQKAAVDAALAALKEATGQTGETLKFEFVDEAFEVTPVT